MPGMPPSLASPLHPLQSIPRTPVPLRNSQAPGARMKGRIRTKCRPATGWLRLQADSSPRPYPPLLCTGPQTAPVLASSSCPLRAHLPSRQPAVPAGVEHLPSPPSLLCKAGKVAESGKEVRRPGWERKQTVQAANGIFQSNIFVCGPNECGVLCQTLGRQRKSFKETLYPRSREFRCGVSCVRLFTDSGKK